MSEHRRYPRVTATNLAALADQGQNWWTLGRTIDLSLQGVALAVPAEIPAGAHVQIALSLHDHVVELEGTVVRSATGMAGGFEACVSFTSACRTYWRLLALTFADQLPAGPARR